MRWLLFILLIVFFLTGCAPYIGEGWVCRRTYQGMVLCDELTSDLSKTKNDVYECYPTEEP